MDSEEKKNEFRVKGENLISKVRELIHAGNVRRIIIKNDEGKIYLEIPVTVGVVGVLLVPVWAALGALAAVASNFTIEIINSEKKEDQ
ncbi:MAG: DUF4342 domain-containing protein [Candidatus Cloacimonetes bacterium]|nr:DUF4342 domain-containing protein [Candidatus Cloacimonadota bacterium]